MMFCARWPNGDFSIVNARNKEEAAVMLDEWGPIEPRDLHRMPETMMADFRIGDNGYLQLNCFGEEITDWILEKFYPLLNECSHESDEEVAEAVEQEKARLKDSCKIDPVEGDGMVQRMAGASSAYMRAVRRTIKERAAGGDK